MPAKMRKIGSILMAVVLLIVASVFLIGIQRNLHQGYYTPKIPFSTVAFYWHIPKSGGTSLDNIFTTKFFQTAPELSFLNETYVNMLDERLMGIGPTNTQLEFSRTYCKQFFSKNKMCPKRMAINYPDLQKSLKYVHSPYLMETLSVLRRHHFRPISTVLLRHPVERFVSEYYYLQYARHEPTFNLTNQFSSIEEYTLRGVYQRNWMVCQLATCPGNNANEQALESAKENLVNTFAVIGFLDNTERFIADCKRAWNIEEEVTIRSEHANRGRVEKKPLTSVGKTLISHAFRYDIELYNFAREKFA